MLISDKELAVIGEYIPHELSAESLVSAAVAVILRDGEQGTEFLLMQRAKHDNDPWSGQMSFPGGKIDPQDESAKAAAVREAYEEVGANLTEDDYLGRLDDIYGFKIDGVYSVLVSSFVFKVKRDLKLVGNHEVADLVWLPMSYLENSENAHYHTDLRNPSLKMPAVSIDQSKNQILWGLTLRMLSNLYRLLNLPMTVLTKEQQQELIDIQLRGLSRQEINGLRNNLRESA